MTDTNLENETGAASVVVPNPKFAKAPAANGCELRIPDTSASLIESEPRLSPYYYYVLTCLLHASRYTLRAKTLWAPASNLVGSLNPRDAQELAFNTVTARRFCDQQEMSLQTATGRSLP